MRGMPKGYPYVRCKACGRQIATRAELSATGLCVTCGPRIQAEQVRQLVEHRGPHFDHWRERCRAAFNNPRLDQPRLER